MKRRLINSLVVAMVHITIVLVSAPGLAADFLERTDVTVTEFQLKGANGAERRLVLLVPVAWEAELHEEEQWSRIHLRTPAGSLVTLVGVLNRPTDNPELRQLVTAMGLDNMSQAVESQLNLRIFPGEQVRGYYFSLTDKSPAPGEWEFLTAGFFALEDSLWMVELLSHERGGSDEDDLLESLKYVRLE